MRAKATRLVPIFPELRPYLEEAWEQAEEGAEFVVSSRGDDTLGTGMERIIRNAGLEPWPKLFQNCRATRATELVAAGWPEYKVCKWLGHTEVIARRHYWQVTDDDLPQGGWLARREGAEGAAKSGLQQCDGKPCKAVQDSQAADSTPGDTTPGIAAGLHRISWGFRFRGLDLV